MATAASASRKATLVCVKAAGLMTIKSVPSWRAKCTRSTKADSELLWKCNKFSPCICTKCCNLLLIWSKVIWPYTLGSRLPSRFRLGPCRTRMVFMNAVCRKLGQVVYLLDEIERSSYARRSSCKRLRNSSTVRMEGVKLPRNASKSFSTLTSASTLALCATAKNT